MREIVPAFHFPLRRLSACIGQRGFDGDALRRGFHPLEGALGIRAYFMNSDNFGFTAASQSV